jgi:hypothetical protein
MSGFAGRFTAFLPCDKPFSPCDKLPHSYPPSLQKFNSAASAL